MTVHASKRKHHDEEDTSLDSFPPRSLPDLIFLCYDCSLTKNPNYSSIPVWEFAPSRSTPTMRFLLAALLRLVPYLVSMAPLRNATSRSDEESAVDGDDSLAAKKPLRTESTIPLFVILSVGPLCIFLTMPEA
ncbi:hypothetical protein BHM03_00029439 [Ensete ventricosum]|nr:hypothetical protein BHM03_00029439 [Ensete ventricosum]